MARKRGALLSCLLQSQRHSHTQTPWEHLLRRKIEPSSANELHGAFLGSRVLQNVPYLAESPFCVPSTKNLEVLAERLQAAGPFLGKCTPLFNPSLERIDDVAVSKATAWSAIQVTNKLMDPHTATPIQKGFRGYFPIVGCVHGLHLHQKMFRNISTLRASLLSPPSTDGKEQPVRSPLTMVPVPSGKDKKTPTKEEEKRPVQAVLKKIKESPKKVNLVAALVRGMRVEDALLQLAVLQKRAAKTVKRVVANARANATHNHGLNGDRLFVAEAFVGKGRYLKRISYHAKGRSGIMHHPSCRLTVIVKEMSAEQEAEVARYKTMTFRERAKVKSRLVPHKLIETSPQWHRTPKESSGTLEA